MKKSTKSTKPAAPQTKSSEPKIVEPKAAKKTAAPRKKSSPVLAAPAAAPAPLAAIAEAPVAVTSTAVAVAPGETTITAQIDVGFGNSLYIRGSSPLSWDAGQLLECVADDKWSVSLPEITEPLSFKFLINDETWSSGPDYVIEPGQSVTLAPTF